MQRARKAQTAATTAQQAFGAVLRGYRVASGLSQEELAERAGLSMRGIANLERGARRSPYRETVLRLADALGLADRDRELLLATSRRQRTDTRASGLVALAADNASVVTNAWLMPPTALVGRDDEVSLLRDRLLRERVRLLTLTGTGGTGKTRLALAVATELREAFEDGVWLVDLVTIREPKLVLTAIARVLGVRDPGEQPMLDTLGYFLYGKQLLLVLDNCEQVLGAGPDLARLLERCPDVQILATSREPLRLRWERLHLVPPLGLPPANTSFATEAVASAPAVRLFVERAQDVRPDFRLAADTVQVVAELCHHLDGLPLAIELAAARVVVLPPQALLMRMERRLDLLRARTQDAPVRHQTLRAAIDWSHDLLSAAEQAVFRRLAVFLGGCTLEAAEAVCRGADLAGADVLVHLESLVDKGLLRCEPVEGDPRFVMLETIREYALDALGRSGEFDQVGHAHAGYYVELAVATEARLHGAEQLAWHRRLDRDVANFRAASQWLSAQGDAEAVEQGLRLNAALWWYWQVRGDHAQARELVTPFLARPAAGVDSRVRARGLHAAANAAWGLGDQAGAQELDQESLRLMRELGDRGGTARCLLSCGVYAITAGDMEGASAALAEAVALARESGDEWITGHALSIWGALGTRRGDLGGAQHRLEEALAIQHRRGDVYGMVLSLDGLAAIAQRQGDTAAARPLYAQGLQLLQALREWPLVATVLRSRLLRCLAVAALAQHDYATAQAHFHECLAVYREMGSARGAGIALSGLAILAAAEGRYARAVRLAGAAAALVEAPPSRVAAEIFGHPLVDATIAAAHRALGKTAAEVAWAAGRAMGLDEAARYALAAEEDGGAAPAHTGRQRAAGPLTPREHEIAVLVARGLTNRQIAETLIIGQRTAEAHVSNMFAKLGLSARAELAAWVAERGLLAPRT